MKVILLKDVPKIGKRHDVKDLAQGYAQNVLISRGLAELATPAALARLSDHMAKIAREKEKENALFAETLALVNGSRLILKAKANEKGHLFKAVNIGDVVRAIKELTGAHIDEDMISIGTIKELGLHEVIIKKGNLKGTCKIVVEQ